uniref:Cholinesterase n=1 Tax=Periophthalmus magnuspinnatus TaxID=409849 RepID=A0A3B4A812_9GOBI
MASPLCTLTALFLLLSSLSTSFSDSDTLRVQTKNGVVRGIIQSHPVPGIHGNASVRAFLGIPFAKPPLGPLRFKPPQPAEKWTKDLEAFSYSNSCYQLPDTTFPGFHGSEMWNPNTPLSEDCLYLNVWTPRVKTSQPQTPAPVMVWIYGGGFTTGTSSLPLYSGLFLSSFENVVVVSMNYRIAGFQIDNRVSSMVTEEMSFNICEFTFKIFLLSEYNVISWENWLSPPSDSMTLLHFRI